MNSCINQKQDKFIQLRSTPESGAFLVLAALVLAVLFGFIALAIDSARTYTSMSEKISTADSIALAALDTYLNREPQLPALQLDRHTFKWDKVKKEVVTYYNSNQSTFAESQTITEASINAKGSGVSVTPGRWWIEKPANCTISGCPCNISAPLYRPCFQTCSAATGCVDPSNSGGDIFATAMEVRLSTEGQDGIKTTFAGILGVNKVDVEGKSYSATTGSVSFALPQIGVLLFDLSRGITIDNYLPFERKPLPTQPAWAARREYSFPLSSDPASGCSATGVASSCRSSCPVSNLPDASYLNEYRNTPPTGVAGNYSDSIYDQYKCYSGNLNGALQRHLVATGPGSLDPEPYNSMLQAANAYLRQFKTQGRAGDRLMLLGFDQFDIPELHFPQANGGAPVFLSPTDPGLDELILMTSNRDEAAKRMFFPRAYSKLDLAEALRTAASQLLTAYPSTKVDLYINLFTNGLSLCGSRNPPSPPSNFKAACASLTDPSASLDVRTENLRKQLTSLDEAVVDLGESILRPNGIKVNVITGNISATMPIGTSATQTHTALLGHWKESRCATDLEIRQWKYLNVIPYPDDDPSATNKPFTNRMIAEFSNVGRTTASSLANINPLSGPPALPVTPPASNANQNIVRYVQPSRYLYSLAATTLGNYVPLRRECVTTKIEDANGYCRRSANRLGEPQPTTDKRVSETRNKAIRPFPSGTPEIDAEWRMLCEPRNGQNSKPPALFSDFSDSIIQSRSIVLVVPD